MLAVADDVGIGHRGNPHATGWASSSVVSRIRLRTTAVVTRLAERRGDDPSPSTEPELDFDVVDVRLDGASGDDQALSNLTVGQSLTHQICDHQFPRAQ
jgi:hypothetical protein